MLCAKALLYWCAAFRLTFNAREVYRNKTCICLYRTKNVTYYIYIIVGIKKSVYVYTETKTKNNYKYTIITPEKNNARISIGKTIRKRPQNKLARRVVRRKEEEKEKRNLLAAMVRRFFHLRRRIV